MSQFYIYSALNHFKDEDVRCRLPAGAGLRSPPRLSLQLKHLISSPPRPDDCLIGLWSRRNQFRHDIGAHLEVDLLPEIRLILFFLTAIRVRARRHFCFWARECLCISLLTLLCGSSPLFIFSVHGAML